MRYIKQRDDYSCGPVALINILKWLGRKCTYTDLAMVKRLCNCNQNGTNSHNMENALRVLGIKGKHVSNLNLLEAVKHLEEGIILLDAFISEDEDNIENYHYFLCVDYDDYHFHVINENYGETNTCLTWREFEDYLDCEAWLIRR